MVGRALRARRNAGQNRLQFTRPEMDIGMAITRKLRRVQRTPPCGLVRGPTTHLPKKAHRIVLMCVEPVGADADGDFKRNPEGHRPFHFALDDFLDLFHFALRHIEEQFVVDL